MNARTTSCSRLCCGMSREVAGYSSCRPCSPRASGVGATRGCVSGCRLAVQMLPALPEAAAVGKDSSASPCGVFRYAERLVGHDLALRMQGALRMCGSTTGCHVPPCWDVGVTCWYGLPPTSTRCWTWSRVIVPACALGLVIIGTTVPG